MGEFSFLDEGRDCDDCESSPADVQSIVSRQPPADWTDDDVDVTFAPASPDVEKATEADFLNKHGDQHTGRTDKIQKKLVYQISKTVIMVLAPAVMALFLELVGPTLLDLMKQSGSNFEQISLVLAARSVGILLGSLAAGIMTDRFPNVPELFMSVSFIVGAFGTSLTPWMDGLGSLGLTFLIQGLAFGFFDVCNNHLCIKMWQEKASCPIHALHFGYGLGALAAPQLARPFVSSDGLVGSGDDIDLADNVTGASTGSSVVYDEGIGVTTANVTEEEVFQSNIMVPYLISSAIAVIFGVVFSLFYVFEKFLKSGISLSRSLRTAESARQLSSVEKKRERRFLRILNPGSCTGGDSVFGLQFFLVAFFLFFNAVGGEHCYTKFLFTYAREGPLHLSSGDAAMVNTLFWICFMAGRGIAIFASRLLHPKIMLITQLSLVLVSSGALCIWAGSLVRILWIFTGVFAFFLGPIMPAGISWCNRYVLMKGTAVAIVFLATGTGSIFYQWLTGYLFQHRGATSLMYVIVGFAVFIGADFLVLLVIVRNKSERFAEVILTEVDEKGNISVIVEAPDELQENF